MNCATKWLESAPWAALFVQLPEPLLRLVLLSFSSSLFPLRLPFPIERSSGLTSSPQVLVRCLICSYMILIGIVFTENCGRTTTSSFFFILISLPCRKEARYLEAKNILFISPFQGNTLAAMKAQAAAHAAQLAAKTAEENLTNAAAGENRTTAQNSAHETGELFLYSYISCQRNVRAFTLHSRNEGKTSLKTALAKSAWPLWAQNLMAVGLICIRGFHC